MEWKFETEQFTFANEDLLKEIKKLPPIYRLTNPNRRIYFTYQSKLPIILNNGTGILDNYRDKAGEIALEKWRRGLINDGKNPSEELRWRQDYGTVLHLIYGIILKNEVQLEYELLGELITNCAIEIGYSEAEAVNFTMRNINEYTKDVASFVQWIFDYKVVPIGIEVMMCSMKYKVATAIDLIAQITIEEKGFWGEVYKSGEKKGEPKETKKEVTKIIIADFKSGKGNGFYPKNVLQLLLNRIIFEENIQSIKLDGVFNFAPNDWVNTPTYKFYDQERDTSMNNKLSKLLPNILERGQAEFEDYLESYKELEFIGSIFDRQIMELSLLEVVDKYYNRLTQETK